MRRERRQDKNKFLNSFCVKRLVDLFHILIFVHLVHELHDGADGGVEVESSSDIFRNLFDCLIQNKIKFFIFFAYRLCFAFFLPAALCEVIYESPNSVQESVTSVYSLVRPVELSVRRCREQYEQSCCVGAVFLEYLIRRYHIAERLTHFQEFAAGRVFFAYHSLREQVIKRLFVSCKTHVMKSHLEES